MTSDSKATPRTRGMNQRGRHNALRGFRRPRRRGGEPTVNAGTWTTASTPRTGGGEPSLDIITKALIQVAPPMRG